MPRLADEVHACYSVESIHYESIGESRRRERGVNGVDPRAKSFLGAVAGSQREGNLEIRSLDTISIVAQLAAENLSAHTRRALGRLIGCT